MIFKQFRYEPVAQASYLLACGTAKQGFVVDPIADLGTDFYLLEAADLGVTLVGILETHIHADYVSCARELAAQAGAPHHLHESALGRVSYQFSALKDGQQLSAGQVELEVLWTPGHTPEHVSYLVRDRSRGAQPWLVLTGDSLLVGDVGRPDLLLGDATFDVMDEGERAAALYGSIKERLFKLPDYVEVYPNHYGGSSCGGVNLSGKASSTIGLEKLLNLPMLQADAASFASFVQGTSRPVPDGYRRIKAINVGLAEKVNSAAAVALNVQAVEEALTRGAIVLDVRPALRFAAGHIPSAVNLQFNRADLADRAQLVLPRDLEIIVHGEPEAMATEAIDLLTGAGFRITGYVRGGLGAWKGAGKPVSRLRVLSVTDLHDHIDEFQVIDARERYEYRRGHIDGAFLLPSSSAWATASGAPDNLPLAVHCGDVARSGLVASILSRSGRNVSLVAGGMNAWREQGYPEVTESERAMTQTSSSSGKFETINHTFATAPVDVERLRTEVKLKYRDVATDPTKGFHFHVGRPLARMLDYPMSVVDALPDQVVESFAGVNNPFSMGELRLGEKVLDIGSGAGFDSILAAQMVGPEGKVTGVDMTPEMRAKASSNASLVGLPNTEFIDGLAEGLPLGDSSVDVVISNGVINLCPDKLEVYREIYRVLKPGGRLQIADVVVQKPVPDDAVADIDLWTG